MLTDFKVARQSLKAGILVAFSITLCMALAPMLPLRAQSSAPETPKAGCQTAKKAEPATPVETGPASGTKNMGATGWSGGGLGGSHNQTENAGPTASSRTIQPETATGLDPAKSASEQPPSAAACG